MRDTTIDQALIQLEIRNAVAQESARAFVLFEHRDGISFSYQLLSAGEPRRAAADHRDGLFAAAGCRFRFNPALIPRIGNNGALNRLHSHRDIGVIHHTAVFAKCGTDAGREFREVVGSG